MEDSNIGQSQTKKLLPSTSIKDVHQDANDLNKEYVARFEEDLRLQANILARNEDNITSRPVKDALSIVIEKRDVVWQEELLLLALGIFLGSFMSGFTIEIRTNPVQSRYSSRSTPAAQPRWSVGQYV